MDEKRAIAEILGNWYERRDRGEEVSPEELIRAHPELADALRSHFELLPYLDFALSEEPEVAGLPRRIGDFRVLREIGRGGMGIVYEAEQTSMGRRVALKVLSPMITSSAEWVRRFRREARSAGRIQHPNIVAVHALGEDKGFLFYAMDLEPGPDLGALLHGGGEPPEGAEWLAGEVDADHFRDLALLIAGVADGLHTAHEAGIVHRDVKPSNLLLSGEGKLKIVDFGLARLEEEGAGLTLTGQLMGTPVYMSPEQARARQGKIDHRTDIYSLGATIYEALTRVPPFSGDTLGAIYSQILADEPVPPRVRDRRIPRDLETIVFKAMEKEREQRYSSAAELAEDLRRFAEGRPILARRASLTSRAWKRIKRDRLRFALLLTFLLLCVAGGAIAWLDHRRTEERRQEVREREARQQELLTRVARREDAGDLKGALTDLRAAEALGGADLEASLAAASLLRRLDREEEALVRLGRTFAEAGRSERVEDWVRLCRACRGRREWSWHEQALEDGIFRLGNAPELVVERAIGRFARGRYADALIDWEVLAGERPEDHLVFQWKGRTLRELGAYAEAEAALDQACRLAPGCADTRVRLGAVLADDLGEHDQALRVFDAALEIDPGHAEARRRKADALCRLGRNELLLAMEANDAEILAIRSLALRRLNRETEADDALKAALRRDPRSSTALYCRYQAGRDRSDLEAALRLMPGDARLHDAMGEACERLGLYSDAMREYGRAAELDPRLARPRVARATLLATVFGEFDHALEILEAEKRRRSGAAGLDSACARIREARKVREELAENPPEIAPRLVFSSIIGGERDDHGCRLILGRSGRLRLMGMTSSPNFPGLTSPGVDMVDSGGFFASDLSSDARRVLRTIPFGGLNCDVIEGPQEDASGCIHFAGRTVSVGYPTVNAFQPTHHGSWDGFVTKLGPDGTEVVYSTFLGGYQKEFLYDLAVDPEGNAYVVGATFSSDFPQVNPAGARGAGDGCGWVAKLDARGRPVYSTFLGASGRSGASAVAADSHGCAYVVGGTDTGDFPHGDPGKAGHPDGGGYVLKLGPKGELLSSNVFLSGERTYVQGVAVDGRGRVFVAGWSFGATLSGTEGVFQPKRSGEAPEGFVAEFDPADLQLRRFTWIGGSGLDSFGPIALDAAGRVYLTAQTESRDYPVTEGAFQTEYGGGHHDAMLTVLSADLSKLLYSTYLGGGGADGGLGITIGPDGEVWVAGTATGDFPLVEPGQTENAGGYDAFIVRFENAAAKEPPALSPEIFGEARADAKRADPPLILVSPPLREDLRDCCGR